MPRNKSEKHPPELIEMCRLWSRWVDTYNNDGPSARSSDLFRAMSLHKASMDESVAIKWRRLSREDARAYAAQ